MARVSRSGLAFRFTAVGGRALRSPIFSGELEAQLLAYTKAHVEAVVAEARVYPPPNPNSTYERTFTDLDSWEVKLFHEGLSTGYRAVNNATDPRGRMYSRYLHGPGVQTDGFQNRARRAQGWRNIDAHLERPGFREGAQAILIRAIAATRGV